MTKNIKMVFESFTNDYFQNTDLDYNIFSTSVYDNLLKETYKSKNKHLDPKLQPLQKSTIESFLDGSEPIVPTQLTFSQPQPEEHVTIKENITSRMWGLSDEMIAIMSLIVLVLYVYYIITKKIDRLIYNQTVLNSNVIKNNALPLSNGIGEVILPQMP